MLITIVKETLEIQELKYKRISSKSYAHFPVGGYRHTEVIQPTSKVIATSDTYKHPPFQTQ